MTREKDTHYSQRLEWMAGRMREDARWLDGLAKRMADEPEGEIEAPEPTGGPESGHGVKPASSTRTIEEWPGLNKPGSFAKHGGATIVNDSFDVFSLKEERRKLLDRIRQLEALQDGYRERVSDLVEQMVWKEERINSLKFNGDAQEQQIASLREERDLAIDGNKRLQESFQELEASHLKAKEEISYMSKCLVQSFIDYADDRQTIRNLKEELAKSQEESKKDKEKIKELEEAARHLNHLITFWRDETKYRLPTWWGPSVDPFCQIPPESTGTGNDIRISTTSTPWTSNGS